MSDDHFDSLSNKKLKKLIVQTRETLSDLHEELEKRKLEKRHEEINHLEEHMDEVEHRFSTFLAFLRTVLMEKK